MLVLSAYAKNSKLQRSTASLGYCKPESAADDDEIFKCDVVVGDRRCVREGQFCQHVKKWLFNHEVASILLEL